MEELNWKCAGFLVANLTGAICYLFMCSNLGEFVAAMIIFNVVFFITKKVLE